MGCLIGANLFTEGSDPLAQRDYYALRAHSGIAPVTKQSGKSKQIVMRRGCSERLRNAMYHWPDAVYSTTHSVRFTTPASDTLATTMAALFVELLTAYSPS